MGTGVIRWLQHLAEQGDLPAATRARLAVIRGYFHCHRSRTPMIGTLPPVIPSPPG